jgi:hypothetical protein
MVERPEKKPKYVSDWRNRPYGEATPNASKKRAELADALIVFIQKNDAWVTSLPGRFPLRVEISEGSALPSKLADLGYSVRAVGRGTRITGTTETITKHSTTGSPIIRQHSGFVPVDILEIEPGK